MVVSRHLRFVELAVRCMTVSRGRKEQQKGERAERRKKEQEIEKTRRLLFLPRRKILEAKYSVTKMLLQHVDCKNKNLISLTF